jgi:hypothetical protein
MSDESMAEKAAPKVFISYSWGSEEHQQKVLEIATRLMQNGVQVVIAASQKPFRAWNQHPTSNRSEKSGDASIGGSPL